MPRDSLLAPAFALLLASPFAMALDVPPAPAAPPATHAQPSPPPDHAPMDRRMHRVHLRQDPDMGAFADLHALERLYREAGRDKELGGVYDEVLARSQDPELRTYAYHRLARLQARPADVDQAITTLRKSLSENLANEAKVRAERERMRAQQQRKAAPEPAAR